MGILAAVLAHTRRIAFDITGVERSVIERRRELIAFYERCGYARTGEIRPFPVPSRDPLVFVVLDKAIG